jgi:hypothetical protein
MTGDRPLREEQSGRDLAVRAALCNKGGDAALGRRQPLLTPAPADAPELAASLLGPVRRVELFETVERTLDRIACVPLLAGPPRGDAEPEQCSGFPEGVSHLVVMLNRPLEK